MTSKLIINTSVQNLMMDIWRTDRVMAVRGLCISSNQQHSHIIEVSCIQLPKISHQEANQRHLCHLSLGWICGGLMWSWLKGV